jgi:hypothetical protein
MLPRMRIARRLKRAVALLLLAALTFAQVTIALAACELDRGSLAHSADVQPDDNCPCVEDSGQLTAGCIVHCTSDLQLAGAATMIVRAPADAPVLFASLSEPAYARGSWRDAHPPGGLPARILFQSFLI